MSAKLSKEERQHKTPMPEQDPKERGGNFKEVPFGYTPEMAMKEAARCLQCKKPFCVAGCPVQVQIPEFIALIQEGEFEAAARKIKETNLLPSICGRVCPQESQCEEVCILAKKWESVAIGRLERFCADYEREQGSVELPLLPEPNGKRVAVVGSGPAGLTVAYDLVLKGYQVTVFEAFHKPGGVLMYGIPEFRLPKAIVESEVGMLEQLAVQLRYNVIIGTTITIPELFEQGYDAVFIGVGAGLPYFLGVPGENLSGIYSASEYLTRSNLMKAYLWPQYDTPIVRGKRVAVIGGGNVAMDSVRTALRLGAKEAIIVYRRAREQMPARSEEIHHAEEEGIIFHLLTNPLHFIGDDNGFVKAMECQRMELGEPDASGRQRPVAIEGSTFTLEVDLAVIAIGSGANPLLTSTVPDLELNKWGNIKADQWGRTNLPGVFAGGDIVTGSATVIEAMGAGRKAATAIHSHLFGIPLEPEDDSIEDQG